MKVTFVRTDITPENTSVGLPAKLFLLEQADIAQKNGQRAECIALIEYLYSFFEQSSGFAGHEEAGSGSS